MLKESIGKARAREAQPLTVKDQNPNCHGNTEKRENPEKRITDDRDMRNEERHEIQARK